MTLDRYCRDLATGTREDQSAAWKDLVTEGMLWPLCQKAIADPNALSMLDACFQALQGGHSLQEAQRHYSIDPGETLEQIEADKLDHAAQRRYSTDLNEAVYTNDKIQRVIAAAGVALLARHSKVRTDADLELPRWAYRASLLSDPLSDLPRLETNFIQSSVNPEADLITRGFEGIAPPASSAEGWSLARGAALMLGANFLPVRQMTQIPILLVYEEDGKKKGTVAYLSLKQLHGRGQLVRVPTMFRWFAQPWREAVQDAWGRVAYRFSDADVIWEISLKIPNALDGYSAQAAFQTSLLLLADRSLYDRDCAISATVGKDNNLGWVEGIVGEHGEAGPKLEAALDAKIRRVVVSPDNFSALSETAREALAKQGLQVLSAPTVAEASAIVSRTATEVQAYLNRVKSVPDRPDELPAYLGGRTLTALYVEPEVLKRIPGSKSVRDRGDASERNENTQRERGSDPRDRLESEARDIGELLFGEYEDREQWRRESWEVERRQMQRGVVLAPPGQGKSLLIQMTAHKMAEEALLGMEQQQIGLAEAPLPILIPLKVLAKYGVAGASEQALRDAIENALVEGGSSPDAAHYLADHVHEQRAWLLLDALDEVEEKEKLKSLLDALKQSTWQCRILLTSRPYGYNNDFNAPGVSEYRLADLSAEQAREFVRKWFTGDAKQERMLALLDNSLAVQRMGQSPFLLTLLCWIVERERITGTPSSGDALAKMTRTQLYARAVKDILGLKANGDIDEQRAEEWMPLVGEVTLNSFIESAALRPLAVGTLLKTIAKSPDRPPVFGMTREQLSNLSPMQQASDLLEELTRTKRFLVPLNAERSEYIFPHRSLLEFLAGWKLADQANEKGWSLIAELVDRRSWLPDWEEVIQFLAGSLEDPIPLLELLSDKHRDDYFRHRLALAALCLPEIAALLEDEDTDEGTTETRTKGVYK